MATVKFGKAPAGFRMLDEGENNLLVTKEFELRLATTPSGTVFDVQMRLVDDESAPRSEIRSGCMTVTVR